MGNGLIKTSKDIETVKNSKDIPIRMTVGVYSQLLGKSTSNITKHIRLGNSLPYVIEAIKSPFTNQWVLLVSPAIKLKQPLK